MIHIDVSVYITEYIIDIFVVVVDDDDDVV